MSRLRQLEPGSVLGRYELVLRVATGGMGEIWAARLKGGRGFQKVVAIKTLLPELSHNPSFEQMFLDEAALAARIKHPNVVQVIDLGEEQQILYQVMEWVTGESLWSVMRAAAKRDGVPVIVAARIVGQVCAGLHAAHELASDDGEPLGLVHRDVSPQNILVTTNGLAKVVDFGVAKYAGRGVAETKAGELRGKVPYMAPEHVLGQASDRRADVFALGLLFYQLVSGEHPFLADDDRLTLARISSPLPAPSLRQKMPSLPEGLADIVASALAKSPSARTPTAAELMRALERAIPESAAQSSNELVADFLRSVVSEQIEARAQELRDALRRLDEGEESEARTAVAPRLSEARVPSRPDAAPPGARESAPHTPAPLAATPSEVPQHTVSGISNTLDVGSEDIELPVAGWRTSFFGRHPLLAAGGAAALVLGGVIAFGASGSGDPTLAPPMAAGAPSGATATADVASPSAPPSAAAAPSSSASSASSDGTAAPAALPAAASSPGVAPTSPRPSPPRPAKGPAIGAVSTQSPAAPPAPAPAKPREFTPKGL